MAEDLSYSRPMATAKNLGADAPDSHRFLNKVVLLTGESPTLSTKNGKETFFCSLMLLIRICRKIDIYIPEGFYDLESTCATIIKKQKATEISVLAKEPDYPKYDAILSVGHTTRKELPWTVINSNGWLARVSSGSTNLDPDSSSTNPIGCLATACLGVTEVFKRLIALKESRGKLLDGLAFSLYSYKSNEVDCGPELPDTLPLNLLVCGVGAIGNGIIHLLSSLPCAGSVNIVDLQNYKEENLGTCLLIDEDDLEKPKAEFAEKYLSDKLKAKGYCEDVTAFRQRLGKELPFPQIILNGLDNIDARHDVQSIWPDLIVDGAISDFGCQVSRHPWSEDTACLRCLFLKTPKSSAVEASIKATGLSELRILNQEDVVTDADVQNAPQSKKNWLREQLGKPICSVIQEGIAKQISETDLDSGFEPSVPFVACFSASMVVGEMVKDICGWPTPLEPRFQFDILRGPGLGQELPQERRRDCICESRKDNIDTIRKRRSAS